MVKRILKAGLGALGLLVIPAQASAAILPWSTSLFGFNEVPPNASPGTGFVTGTLDNVTGLVVITSGTFSGLVAPATAAHIHGLAPAGVNAGVIIPLTATAATSGTISGSGILSPTNIAGMIAGLTYVNLHTSTFPGGELRGQNTVVPEPASILALLGGAGALAARRRRTKPDHA